MLGRIARFGRAGFAYLQSPRALRARLTWPVFNWQIYRTLDRLERGGAAYRVIVDVGANVGAFSLASAHFFPTARIEAFEPVTKCQKEFRVNLSAVPSCRLWPVALGNQRTRVTLNENEYTPSSSVLPLLPQHEASFPCARRTTPVQVEVETLDSLMESIQPAPPCLLKIDVQGYEREVLNGGRQFLACVDDLIIECSLRPLYRGAPLVIEIIKDLYEYGFELADVEGDLRDPRTRRALQVDLLFSRTGRTS